MAQPVSPETREEKTVKPAQEIMEEQEPAKEPAMAQEQEVVPVVVQARELGQEPAEESEAAFQPILVDDLPAVSGNLSITLQSKVKSLFQ